MAAATDILLEPLTIRHHTLRNRIVLAPMVSNRGIVSEAGLDWYEQFARGGVGLGIVEASWITEFGGRLTVENLSTLVERFHRHGALAAIQLYLPPPDSAGSVERPSRAATPTDLSPEQIAAALEQFHAAARIAVAAGFDGVELHGAHGYLLNRFFSPAHNQRTDAYGGNLGNRMRLGLEATAAVREAIGAAPLLLYRHTPVEHDAYPMAESLEFAARLIDAGVDVLDISPSSDRAPGDRAAPFRELGRVPVIGVGAMGDVERALEGLGEGRCDLVAIGRGLIADPEWVNKVARGAMDDIIECYECNQGCFGNLQAGKPITCSRRP